MAVGGPGTGSFGNALPVTPTGIRGQHYDPGCVDSKFLEDRVGFETQGLGGGGSPEHLHISRWVPTKCQSTWRASREGIPLPPRPRQPSPDRILNLPTPSTPGASRAGLWKAWLRGVEPKETGATSSLLLQLPSGARQGPPRPLTHTPAPRKQAAVPTQQACGALCWTFGPLLPRDSQGEERPQDHFL